jgi:hypothetical protein
VDGGEVSPAGKKSGEGAQVLIAGGFLVVNGYKGVAYEERGFTARLMAWSASSAASCGEVEG